MKPRLHLDTARRFVREGKLPATKIGRRYLIPSKAIEEFIAKSFVVIGKPAGQNGSAVLRTIDAELSNYLSGKHLTTGHGLIREARAALARVAEGMLARRLLLRVIRLADAAGE